jgi:hypothetical protein
MSSTLSLLVPMNVTALCVSQRDQSSGLKFGKIAAEFQNLATKPYLGSSVLPKPFEEESVPPGIHLHWALPDALTRSDPSDANGFRQAPNRFLVVRFAAGETSVELEKKAWIVESDYLWKDEEKSVRERDPRNALSRAVPREYTVGERTTSVETNFFAYQGRVRPLSDAWRDSQSSLQHRFTALGYGTEAYAAAYPHCRNVFGFFDPLFDPVNAPDGLGPQHRYLSYLVIGWYSDLGWDPISLVRNGKCFKKIFSDAINNPEKMAGGVNREDLKKEAVAEALKADYRWSYQWRRRGPGQAKGPVQQTLFVGQLTALKWIPNDSYPTPNNDAVAVALGTTTAEALSALLASTKGPDNAAVETLLNDIQFDLLREYATAAGQASRSDALHQRDFAPVPAGHEGGKSPSLFVAGDIKDVPSLLTKLQNDPNQATRPVSEFVWTTINPVMKQELSNPNSTSQLKESVSLQALNTILEGTSIYDPTRFAGVTLRPETQLLIPQSPTGERLIRLNRLLLEDTYPQEIGAAQSGRGRIWIIKRTGSAEHGEQLPAARTGELADAARAMGLALPEDLGTALNALNLSQAVYDELAAAVATRRGQVFADWTRYLPSKDDATWRYIDKEIAALDHLVQEREAKEKARDRARAALTGLLQLPQHTRTPRNGLVPPAYEYELDSVIAPRYYQPNDPVILLSGVEPSNRYGGDGRFDPDKQGNLICRSSDEITTAGELANIAQDKRAVLNRFCARADWAGIITAALPRPEDLISLCVEACLLNPWMGRFIGSADLEQHQNDYIARGNTANFKGVAPSRVGFRQYAQPWIPLILQWETTFSPFQPLGGANQTQTPYPVMWGLQNFKLSHSNPEIEYTGANPGFSGPGLTTYQGTVTLTHNVQVTLTQQIDNYLKRHPLLPDRDAPAVQQMKRTLEEMSRGPFKMMAQSMEGFHRQLLMREQTLQMRVVAPPPPGIAQDPALKAKYLEGLRFASKVSNAVLGEKDASWLEGRSHYNPLRAGILKVTRLRVLDAFGQIRDVIDPSRQSGVIQPGAVILSSRLNKAPKEWNEPGAAVLPLRIAQPARLSFRYRSASKATSGLHDGPEAGTILEMNSDPASSPIFGWVLYNRFDHALAVYDEDGRPVGSFNLLGPAWQETPGPNRGVGNPHLLEFLEHLGGPVPKNPNAPNYATFREFLGKLIDTIDDAVAGIEPDSYKQDQGLAVLIGRPLALVLADLRLDLYGTMPGEDALPGLPAIDQSREAFDVVKSDPSYVEKRRPSADFARVRFPVRLGDDAKVHDGLVGYFVKGQDAAATYRTFFSHSAASGGSPNVATPPLTAAERLSLAPADKLPKTVVMLVDPRSAVHASVGILPVKSIALPPVQYADALKRIDATFLVAPVLGGADSVALPVPTEVGHAWSWLTRQADEELFSKSKFSVRKWMTQDLVVSPNSRAAFSAAPLRLSEGWLHLYPVETSSDSAGREKPAPQPTPYDILVKPDVSGGLMLAPESAKLHGARIAVAETDDGKRFIGYWNDPREYVTWKTKLAAGTWNVQLSKRYISDEDDVDAQVAWEMASRDAAFYKERRSMVRSQKRWAEDTESQIEIEVRNAKTATVVASRQAVFPRGQQLLLTSELAIAVAGEYEVRIKLLQGAINLERVDLIPRKQ